MIYPVINITIEGLQVCVMTMCVRVWICYTRAVLTILGQESKSGTGWLDV